MNKRKRNTKKSYLQTFSFMLLSFRYHGWTRYRSSTIPWESRDFFIVEYPIEFLFLAGESDIDQLYRIQKCLGPLPSNYMEALKSNPKFEGVKVNQGFCNFYFSDWSLILLLFLILIIGDQFPPIQHLETLERRYGHLFPPDIMDLFKVKPRILLGTLNFQQRMIFFSFRELCVYLRLIVWQLKLVYIMKHLFILIRLDNKND